jgi:arginine/serine-rich splicing factor 12
LPHYPNLPGTLDQLKSEEIRRTVYVSNLDPRVQFAHLYELFSQVGEICYIRFTTNGDFGGNNLGLSSLSFSDENANFSEMSIGAYIEFSEQPMVVRALCLNGLSFADRQIKVNMKFIVSFGTSHI